MAAVGVRRAHISARRCNRLILKERPWRALNIRATRAQIDGQARKLLESHVSTEGFPSGQREQTVNLPALPSKVRILPPPPGIGDQVSRPAGMRRHRYRRLRCLTLIPDA